MRKRKSLIQQAGIWTIAISSLVVLTTQPAIAQQNKQDFNFPPAQSDQEAQSSQDDFQATKPRVEKSGTESNWMVYGGAIALGVGAIALAAGGGSSSSSSGDGGGSGDSGATGNSGDSGTTGGSGTPEETAPPTDFTPIDSCEPVVGPSLGGSDWQGTLTIVTLEATQAVSATVKQCGSSIQIATSTTFPYGRYFSGTISATGFIKVYDRNTNEDWTTYQGNATSTQLRIYDIVDGSNDLDGLELTRTLAP